MGLNILKLYLLNLNHVFMVCLDKEISKNILEKCTR